MEQFCYKQEDETLYLRGAGRLTSQNSEEFKKTVFEYLNNFSCKNVFLDLSHCQYMDSTFLGLLVGFYKKIRKHGKFLLVSPSSEALYHLRCMGLDRLLKVASDSIGFPSEMGNCAANPTVDPKSILKAHRNLMEISAENAKKFALLASVLENTIKNQNTIEQK